MVYMICENDWYDSYDSIELFYSEKSARERLESLGAQEYRLTIVKKEISE